MKGLAAPARTPRPGPSLVQLLSKHVRHAVGPTWATPAGLARPERPSRTHAVPHYATPPGPGAVDRAAHLRKDAAALAALATRPDARALLITPRGEALVLGDGTARGAVRPALLRLAAAAGLSDNDDPPLFLGLREGGEPVFAVILPKPDPTAEADGARWAPVVSDAGPAADPASAAVLALAAGLAAFTAGARFDASSGAPLVVSVDGGHARRPAESGGGGGRRARSTRPRVDPAVLVLTTAAPPAGPAWALLGRKPTWPPRRYSLLAGFVELGESLECACAREVREESGVEVEAASLVYRGSQPWPFPRSLMVAYEGRAVGGEKPAAAPPSQEEDEGLAGPAAAAAVSARAAAAALASLPPAAPLDGELADVRWFPADAVLATAWGAPHASGLAVPGPHALAHSVLKDWSSGQAARSPPLPPVNPAATEPGPGRPYLLCCVEEGGLVVRAAVGGSFASLEAGLRAEAAGMGVGVVSGGWLRLGEAAPGAALTPLVLEDGEGGGGAPGPPRHGLAAAVLRVALPLHEVGVAG